MENKKKARLVVFLVIAVIATVTCLTACNKGGLDVPQNVKCDDSFTVSWDAVNGADHYMIMFNGNDKKQFTTDSTRFNIATASEQVINELKSGETNTLQVRAANITEQGGAPKNMSKWSESIEFTFTKKVSTVTKFSVSGNTIKWRSVQESGAKYKLFVRVKGETTGTEKDLSSYSMTPNATTGLFNLDISDILAPLDNKVYEITMVAYLDGYEDSEYTNFVEIDLSDGKTEVPGGDTEIEVPDNPGVEGKTLTSITAYYTGADVKLGKDLVLSEIIVYAYYSDESSAIIKDTSKFTTNFAQFKDSEGTHEVTISYSEDGVVKTAVIEVTVVDKKTGEPIVGCVILGINNDWEQGIEMQVNPIKSSEYMIQNFEVNGTDGIKIYLNGVYCGNVKDGVDKSIYTIDAKNEGNIVLKAGAYDMYYDSVSNQIWIEVTKSK